MLLWKHELEKELSWKEELDQEMLVRKQESEKELEYYHTCVPQSSRSIYDDRCTRYFYQDWPRRRVRGC